jgi:cobalt-zinc-cadmium efflux system outer membrane protein
MRTPELSIRPVVSWTALALVLCSMLLAGTAHAAGISLGEALAAAASNLDVTIATRGLAAAQADIAAADHAPLPQLSAKLSQIDLQNGIGGGNPFTQRRIDKGVGIDWTWERGDKRGLRTEAARRGAQAAAADLDEIRIQQQLATSAAFYDLLSAQGRIAELALIERSARQTAAIARTRLNSGDVAAQDADRAAIEAERVQADGASAQLDLQRARLVLALLTGREAAAGSLSANDDWPAAAPASPADIADTADEGVSAQALAALLDRRADVRAAAERVRAAEAALQGSSAQRHSDVTWGASFDHYPGTSTRLLEFRLSMPLAFGYHYEGEIARSQAQLELARDTLDKTRHAASAELQRLRAEWRTAGQRARRYDGEIVPRSREVAQRAELAYSKGALPLTDLLDARRTLRAVLLDALAARSEQAKAQAAWQLRSALAAPLRNAAP